MSFIHIPCELRCAHSFSPRKWPVNGAINADEVAGIFRDAPSSVLPRQPTGDVDVLGVLIESLKFFDKAYILNASSCSYKKPKVKISTSHGCDIPRESVYDTELLRILANWLRKLGWSVVGQWHSENNLRRHKYSDILLKESHTIVLELLATGEPSSVESHIQKIPEYARVCYSIYLRSCPIVAILTKAQFLNPFSINLLYWASWA